MFVKIQYFLKGLISKLSQETAENGRETPKPIFLKNLFWNTSCIIKLRVYSLKFQALAVLTNVGSCSISQSSSTSLSLSSSDGGGPDNDDGVSLPLPQNTLANGAARHTNLSSGVSSLGTNATSNGDTLAHARVLGIYIQ